MVSEMIRRDFVRFMVIPATVLPAFAVAFCVLFKSIGGGEPDTNAAAAANAHSNFGNSAFSLVLLGVGLGGGMGETMAAGSDSRIMLLLLLYILLVPIMALYLLVAMMADTYVDVRSAALNRWSLKQAEYVLSRQRFAQLAGRDTHFPKLDAGYKFSGKYSDFFTGDGSATEESEKNLRKSTFDEARRASRLAEVAVEAIDGLNELFTAQLEKSDEEARAREARLNEKLAEVSAILRVRTT